MQFQCRILQWIGNTILTQLRANGANDHSLRCGALNNETTNHHVVAGLDKGARTDVAQQRASRANKIGLQSVHHNGVLAIGSRAGNRCDRRAKLVTMPNELALVAANVVESVGANYVSGGVPES